MSQPSCFSVVDIVVIVAVVAADGLRRKLKSLTMKYFARDLRGVCYVI